MERKSLLRSIVRTSQAIFLGLILFITQGISTFGQSSGFTFSPLVKRGDSSPDGGRFLGCDDCVGYLNGSHAFNNKSVIGISAETEGKCFDGLFLVSSEKGVVLADSCTETPWGKLGYGAANINNQSQAAFQAFPLMNDRLVTTIFIYSEGRITRIIGEGDPTSLGTKFQGCGFSAPSINDKSEIAFGSCTNDGQVFFRDGIFVYSNGQIIPIAVNEDVTNILPGKFYFNFFPAVQAFINNHSDVLFQGKIIPDSLERERYGWFLKTNEGIRKIFIDADSLGDGLTVKERTQGISDLNDKGEVVFSVLLDGKADSGIFVRSGDKVDKIMLQGDATPIGGKFSTLNDNDLIDNFLLLRPRINANSAVTFKAKVIDGNSRLGIFLASPKAMLKVVAVGDEIPTGETIKEIDTFALNDNGEVAFFAYGRKGHSLPLGVFKATPVLPVIKKIKLKHKSSGFELRVIGNGFITNDSVIESNGVALEQMSYPEDSRENGGATLQIISRDARLKQLLIPGQPAQIKVFNSLTNRRSEVKEFTR